MNGKPATSSKAQQIVSEARRRIVDREWRPGDRIPDESELAIEFGVARATVNKALQQLADEGLLDRKRRAGTHVAVNPVRKATLSIPVIREQIGTAGMTYSHRLFERRTSPVPEDMAQRLHLPKGEVLIRLRAVHYGDGRPFQAEDRWINPRAAPGVDDVDFNVINANEWLVRNAPYLRADLVLSAENADAEDARLLEVRRDTALLIMQRTTWNDLGAITTVRVACHPGFTMSAAF